MFELWYIDEYFYAACNIGWKCNCTGDFVKMVKIKRANSFQLQSEEGTFFNWDYERNNGMVIKRSIQPLTIDKVNQTTQLSIF